MSNTTRTLLKVLIDQRHWRYTDFERHFHRATGQVLDGSARNLTVSESQFRRWTSGKVKTMPGPDTCRVLEHLFGVDVAALFAPPPAPDVPAPAFNLEDEIAMEALGRTSPPHDCCAATSTAPPTRSAPCGPFPVSSALPASSFVPRESAALTNSRYRGTALAAELGERIEDFTRLSASHQLGTSTGPLALEP
jgi:hypothetical protein